MPVTVKKKKKKSFLFFKTQRHIWLPGHLCSGYKEFRKVNECTCDKLDVRFLCQAPGCRRDVSREDKYILADLLHSHGIVVRRG